MKRFAAIALLALLSPLARAATPSLYVVEVMSFDCPACRSALAIDAAIEGAADQADAKLVYAPLPRQRSSVREQFFYAMQGMGVTEKVMEAMFSGAQGLGYPLMTQSEVLDWLHSDLQGVQIDWSGVLRRVDDGQAQSRVRRAILLAYRAGVTTYPSFVFVRDNKILGVLDIATAGGSLSQLRSAVIGKIQQISPASAN